MPILQDYHHFDGLHWQSGYLHNVLAYQGIKAPHTGEPLSEAMLMGIGGGLCAGYFAFEYEGHEPHLHFLTRYPFNDEMPPVIYERLGIARTIRQTPDSEKAVANVIGALAQGKPSVVWVDVNTLAYDPNGFAPDIWLVMPVVVYGYELAAQTAHIADRSHVPLVVSTERLAAARARVSKMKNRMMTIGEPDMSKLPAAVKAGIKACIDVFTGNPPVGGESAKRSFGFNAYLKWADLLTNPKGKKSWAKQFAPGSRMYAGLTSAFRYIDVWFTGGRGARHIYANFLDEAAQVLGQPELSEVAKQFRVAASQWQVLTSALLPDSVAPFKETRELMVRDYTLFLAQGQAAFAERQQITQRLQAIKAEMGKAFPLTDAQAAVMRNDLRDHIMAIHDVEVAAISDLSKAAIGY